MQLYYINHRFFPQNLQLLSYFISTQDFKLMKGIVHCCFQGFLVLVHIYSKFWKLLDLFNVYSTKGQDFDYHVDILIRINKNYTATAV